MPRRIANASRREFLKTTAAVAGAGYWLAGSAQAANEKSPSERLRFACVGVGGKGASDTADAGISGDIVALCDVDENFLAKAAKAHPKAKKYNDFRKMFDEMGSSIDAVTVSTPDHTHACITAMALRMGKHCFTQKPLTHTLYETRVLSQLARETKVATQMGNQGTALPGLRHAAAMLRKGVVGNVHDIHVWTDRPIWAQGGPRPKVAEVPKHLQWDLWLGPAQERPYGVGYHPFSWRGFWAFGTGALGDMACHTMNMPYMALDLRNPISVEADTTAHNGETYPNRSIIRYQFAANDRHGPLTLTWYDGGNRPPVSLFGTKKSEEIAISGSLVIGDKGMLYSPADYAKKFELLGGAMAVQLEMPKPLDHFQEWVRAIKGGPPATSNFADYAGPLTETVLLGNLAVWSGRKIEWDAENLRVKNDSSLDGMIKTEYRAGYTL